MKKILLLLVIAFVGFSFNAASQTCDTLRNWTFGNPLSSVTGATGYVPGHEVLGGDNILIWAEPMTTNGSTELRAFRFVPTDISDAGGSITLTVRQNNAGTPGAVMASQVVPLADLTDGVYTTIQFTAPVTFNGNFFACVEVEYSNYPSNELGFLSQEVTTGTLLMYDNTFGWDAVSNVYTLNSAPAQLSMVLDVLTSNAPDPVADFTINGLAACMGNDFILDGSLSQNTDEYSWFLTGPSITPIHDTDNGVNGTLTPTVTGNDQEIYLLADGGCRTDGIFTTVDVFGAVSSTVSSIDPTCGLDNGEINITAPTGGDGTYSYSIDGGSTTQTQTQYTGLAANSYDVVVSTVGVGCEYTETVTLTTIPPETITVGGDETVCEGDPVTITASGNGAIEWFDGGGNSVGTGTSVSVSPTTTATYEAVLTDANGCTDTDQVQVTVNPTPVIDPLANQTACDSYILPAITGTNLTGNEAYYDAPNGGGTQFNAGDVINTAGTMTLYIYNETGTTPNCFDEQMFDLTINALPTVDAGNDEIACTYHSPITLSGTPTGGTFSGTGVTGNEFDPAIGAGTYTVTYTFTDGNGCEASDDLTVTIDGCASINESNLNEGITVMPNPATNFADIFLEGANTLNSVQVTSTEGKVVEVSTSSLNATTTRIDLSKVSNGTYLIQMNTSNGQVIRRIVVQ